MNARISITSAAACCLLLCRGVTPAAAPDTRFHGDTIPVPPAQHEKWTPPKGAPEDMAEVTRLIFELGMADPRGCEYREVKVATGDVWGNYDGQVQTMTATVVQTHGWLLPAKEKDAQRFAICWNGLVYPVLSVGEPCDVDKDVQAQTTIPDDKQERFRRGFMSYLGAPAEDYSVAFDTPLALKAMMLLRLGKTDAASDLWTLSTTDPDNPQRQPPKEFYNIYSRIAGMWLFCLYDRAVCSWMRGDDDLALASLRQLAPLVPQAKKTFQDNLPKPPPPGLAGPGGPFDFLGDVPAYLADMERRHKEPPRKSALELGRDKFPDKAAWIKALLDDMEDVYAPQDGQPGWPMLDDNPTVKALVKEGNDAVPALLDCLEHDDRYTRTAHFWRDFAPSRNMIRSYEAAYTALREIFQTDFFEVHSTGADLTNGGPDARAKVVAAIRAYWEKRKGTSREEQWFITLADDTASPDQWAEAARNIAKSALSLREKKNPSVSDLLAKRIDDLEKLGVGKAINTPPVLDLLESLESWDDRKADYIRATCNKLVANYAKSGDESSYLANSLLKIADYLLARGDKQILGDYANWLRTIPPVGISCGFGGDSKPPWFKLLWQHQENDTMQKTADFLFTDKNSPWLRYMHENTADNEALEMISSPLVGVPAFRKMLLSELGDKTKAGFCGYLIPSSPNFRTAMFGNAQNGRQVMAGLNPLDPLSKNPPEKATFRVCDLYAWALRYVEGIPVLEFYWPVEKRDAAIQAVDDALQHYGSRYNVTEENPGSRDDRRGFDVTDAQMWFPRLDHPATQADVDNGLAVFALPPDAKARTVALPKYPMSARLPSVKVDSENAGNSDEMGRTWMTVDYLNGGHVWQAEEEFVNGKWQRWFSFTGCHRIAKVPAEEVEFPANWKLHWQGMSDGFDCELETVGGYPQKPLPPGAPLAFNVKIRNRCGIDQAAPQTLSDDGVKTLLAGVDIHLYRKNPAEAGQVVKQTKVNPADLAKPAPGWSEIAPKNEIAHFDPPRPARNMAPTDEAQVLSFKLNDLYDLSAPGEYYIEITFDKAKSKFAGGKTNYVKFRVGPSPGTGKTSAPAELNRD